MTIVPGSYYRAWFAMTGAEALGPAWLVGAIAVSYPRMEVESVESYGDKSAVVLMRFMGAQPIQITEGASVSAVLESIPIPGQLVPTATITKIEAVPRAVTLEQALSDAAKLFLAAGILVTTWKLSSMVRGAVT